MTYAILKFIGSFSAFLAPFSLLMVIVLPPKLNWIGYLLAYVMFGILVTCFYLDDHQPDKPSAFNNFVFTYGFFLSLHSFFMPSPEINWIMYPWMYVLLWIEVVYHFVASLMFIYKKTRKAEGLPLIQREEDNTNDPPPYASYLMQLRN
ncbi:hypothetical protein QVD17_38420 [Tagetes erecta]|uniref:Uncharacterized protein n=1 Tax=Tagetes erecta TaxID=13708 RepID=A0AAD8JQJ8_TARER|nr:hypothetical protein QVD17_38420 [Tagetes erecta]